MFLGCGTSLPESRVSLNLCPVSEVKRDHSVFHLFPVGRVVHFDFGVVVGAVCWAL